jgi:hypothetical protein
LRGRRAIFKPKTLAGIENLLRVCNAIWEQKYQQSVLTSKFPVSQVIVLCFRNSSAYSSPESKSVFLSVAMVDESEGT